MKIVALLTLLVSTLAYSAPASWYQVSLIEESAKSFLNDDSIEVLDANIEFVGRSLIAKVTFTYDKEFFDGDYTVATFDCEGTTVGKDFAFRELECVEREPTLWDEF